ncbi:MAG: TonB-dependent receptor [Oceanicaulis sp.]
MAIFKKLSYGASLAALLAAAPAAAVHAQETTGAISGQIVSQSGAPVSGASVTVIHTPTGSVSTAVTGPDGSFNARNLRVGGPYTVAVTADGFAPARAEGLNVRLGQTNSLSLTMESGAATADVIVVTGQAVRSVETAFGPSAVFSQEVLENAPAINRTLTDVVRIDPRIYVDEAFVDGIQCAGANSRFNSLTVDGVRLNDAFGLNSNGFPTERQPFSYDAIEQVAVELAPFDVQYGGFSACNINAVTKSGANEFFGGAFYDYTSNDLRGDSREGSPVTLGDYTEERWGFNLGGPIIRDRLFFFVAYEELEGANLYENGFVGSGALNEMSGFTEAEFNRIQNIAQTLYGTDIGGLSSSNPSTDEKLFVKLDWEINTDHRLSATYNWNDGLNIVGSDTDADEFEYDTHLRERGAILDAYTVSLFSNWTDNFSTEVRVNYLELENIQNSLSQDRGLAEFIIEEDDDNTIYWGQDDSRQSNELNYDVFNLILRGIYDWNDHSISFGYERETTDVFNLFVQHSVGTYRFSNVFDGSGNLIRSGIDMFELGIPNAIDYGNSPGSLDPNDAAASFAFNIDTAYVQDEWSVSDALTVTFGLRYDYYTSDDRPTENPEFVANYGYTNAEMLDGEGLLQPRVGFQWDAADNLRVRGGFGLYSGGNPNVWLSNNFSTDFVSKLEADESEYYGALLTGLGFDADEIDDYLETGALPSLTLFDPTVSFGGGGTVATGVPTELVDAIRAGNGSPGFEMNSLDPDFEIPGEWKLALGATYDLDIPLNNFLGGGYTIDLDFLYARDQNPATIVRRDLVLRPESEWALGGLFPLYEKGTNVAGTGDLDPGTLELTNSDEQPETISIAVAVRKEYDFGLDWTFGYAYNDAEDVNPMTSSVAFSNFTTRAFVDPNDPAVATSNYNIENRFTFLANYETDWLFEDYFTRFSLFAVASEGRPFSYTMNSRSGNHLSGTFDLFLTGDPYLLYVPTGASDPNVDLSGLGADTAAFFDYLESTGLNAYAGGFAPRNAFNGGWWTKADLRIEQEFPGLLQGHRTNAFIVIDNFTNLLNDEWGILREASFPRRVSVVDARLSGDRSQLQYSNFNPRNSAPVVGDASLWEVRVGVRYEF